MSSQITRAWQNFQLKSFPIAQKRVLPPLHNNSLLICNQAMKSTYMLPMPRILELCNVSVVHWGNYHPSQNCSLWLSIKSYWPSSPNFWILVHQIVTLFSMQLRIHYQCKTGKSLSDFANATVFHNSARTLSLFLCPSPQPSIFKHCFSFLAYPPPIS